MPSLAQSTIRLELDVALNPPASPIDVNTGKTPQLYRGKDVAIQLGIFQNGVAVNLSNLAFLEVSIYPAAVRDTAPDTNFAYGPFSNQPYPTTPPAPLFFASIPSTDISAVVSPDAWSAGLAQQATATFTAIQTSSFDLGGAQSAPFIIVVRGLTSSGAQIVYGVADLTVYETGSQGVYLPNTVAPIDVPDGSILYIAPNQQLSYSMPIRIEGTVVIDGGTLVQI